MNEYVQFFTEECVELLSNIAWPVSVLIILLVIKKPFFDMLTKIKKIKYADFEAEMCSIAESLSEFTLKDKKYEKKQTYEEILFDNPNIAIFNSWIQFETELRKKYNKIYPDIKNQETLLNMVNRLIMENKLPSVFRGSVYRLNSIRNAVAHNVEEFSVAEAKKIIDNINIMKVYIENNL